jgi:hypothetical protein
MSPTRSGSNVSKVGSATPSDISFVSKGRNESCPTLTICPYRCAFCGPSRETIAARCSGVPIRILTSKPACNTALRRASTLTLGRSTARSVCCASRSDLGGRKRNGETGQLTCCHGYMQGMDGRKSVSGLLRRVCLRLLAGAHPWGSFDIQPDRFGVIRYRLVVFPPGISESERRRVRVARGWPAWGLVAWIICESASVS